MSNKLHKNSLISPDWKTALEKSDKSCIQGIQVLIARVRFSYLSHITHTFNSASHTKKQNEEDEDKSQGCQKRSKEDEAECSLLCICYQQTKNLGPISPWSPVGVFKKGMKEQKALKLPVWPLTSSYQISDCLKVLKVFIKGMERKLFS